MKNLIKYGFIAFVICCLGCSYKHDGLLVKDTEGKLYRITGNGKTSEGYNVEEIDLTDYNELFNNR